MGPASFSAQDGPENICGCGFWRVNPLVLLFSKAHSTESVIPPASLPQALTQLKARNESLERRGDVEAAFLELLLL